MSVRLVVIGGSWGGLAASARLLATLPREFPAAVALVLHRSSVVRSDGLDKVIAVDSTLPVREVDDHDPIEAGVVHVAPADYHLLVGDGVFELSVDDRVNSSRPSIDVAFESAADAFGAEVVGVLLSGTGKDGSAGLRAIRASGGTAIVQDPSDALKPEMPAAALAIGAADRVLPLDRIGPALAALCGGHALGEVA